MVAADSKNFFDGVDNDKDGAIEVHELKAFVRNSLGGESYDSEFEINQGVSEALKSFGGNEKISMMDLQAYLNSLENVMSVVEVGEWLEHALLLPQFAPVFRQHGITGIDFPLLLSGNTLADDFGISSKLFQQKISRAIKMKILGIGKCRLKMVLMYF